MAKPITQVRDWIREIRKAQLAGDQERIDALLHKAEWAEKVLTRIDARDSQNQKKRKTAKRRTAK